MAKYKAVIFDMDGTILNTLEDLADTLNYALSQNGCKRRTLDEVRQFVGNGIGKLIERAAPEADTAKREKIHADFTRYYTRHCGDKTRPYDGILELLRELREAGSKTAVVSNKADYGVQLLCAAYFDSLFDEAVGEREGMRKKPHSDMLDEVLLKLGCTRTEAVYVGDSEVDIKTAQNAGMDCIIVGWGFREKEFLLRQGAKVLADNMESLRRALL